jgi:hypothetical protein
MSLVKMATTSILRLRRSAGQLHALAQVEREIRATDRNGRLKYLRDFRDAFRSYQAVLTSTQLQAVLSGADLLLIGDYHALPASQRFAGQVVRRLAASGRPVVLGLETVLARQQRVLDLWLQGEIGEAELRDRLRFDTEWGYDWGPFFELLQCGRSHAQALYGLDCVPRSDMRRIAARDRHAAVKIAELRERYPGAAIVVLFGESHLAPNHLPELLRARMPGERILTVLQNVDSLYWRAAGERDENVEAVRVSDDVVCVFNSTPLEKYENYRLCIERWRQVSAHAPDLAPTIYNLIDALLRFLNINKYSATNHTQPRFMVDLLPEVYCRSTEEQWRRLLGRELREAEIKLVLARLEEHGSCYVPGLNAICAANFRIVQGAEEVARFVHHACRGVLRQRETGILLSPEDLFYARALEHALACFGSRVLFPARPAVREADLYALYSQTRDAVEQQMSPLTYREFMQMVDFLLLHKDYEANHRHYFAPPVLIQEGRRYTGQKFDYVTQQLGNMLGSELYAAYVSGRVHKRFLRALFLKALDRPGAAHAAYFATVGKLRLPRKRLVS